MKKLLTSLSIALSPLLVLAQITTEAVDAFSLIRILQNVVDVAIPFIIGLAVLVFLYGLFQFVTAAGDEEARANAKNLIIWSVIAIFVMVSVWGLVNILRGTLNLDTEVNAPAQTFQIPTDTDLVN